MVDAAGPAPLHWLTQLLIIAGLLVVSLTVYYVAQRRQAARNWPRTIQAEVMAKRTYTWIDRIGFYVTFRPDGKDPWEVEVSMDCYEELAVGDRGNLTLAGEAFCGFHKG
jgi:hypothetical protein